MFINDPNGPEYISPGSGRLLIREIREILWIPVNGKKKTERSPQERIKQSRERHMTKEEAMSTQMQIGST